jgi:benzoyl-CoA reductase/2-hydroxyglutaryl-CoA dehydratase subunit BcrC/BadD/HgdB
MGAMAKLSEHLRGRMVELRKAKDEGRKIVGYTPGGYFPEELALAAGVVPVGLLRGGEHEPVAMAGAYMSRWFDTFARAQIGYRLMKEDAAYQLIDLLVVPVTNNHMRAIADAWDFYTDVEVFRFGVPHRKNDRSCEYYLSGIRLLREKLESLTGANIEDSELREMIDLCNNERRLLEEISLMRKSDRPPISGRDFARLNHASFLADKKVMVEVLESLRDELKDKKGKVPRARILLTGSTMAFGDYKIYDLIEETGAEVVVEEFAEGIRHYWWKVEPDSDLMNALADRYFSRRVCAGWFRPGRERLDYNCQLAKEFKVDGVIWYQCMYHDCYDMESYYFPKILKEQTGLSMLKIATDYDASETGPFRTRVETFVETMK